LIHTIGGVGLFDGVIIYFSLSSYLMILLVLDIFMQFIHLIFITFGAITMGKVEMPAFFKIGLNTKPRFFFILHFPANRTNGNHTLKLSNFAYILNYQ